MEREVHQVTIINSLVDKLFDHERKINSFCREKRDSIIKIDTVIKHNHHVTSNGEIITIIVYKHKINY